MQVVLHSSAWVGRLVLPSIRSWWAAENSGHNGNTQGDSPSLVRAAERNDIARDSIRQFAQLPLSLVVSNGSLSSRCAAASWEDTNSGAGEIFINLKDNPHLDRYPPDPANLVILPGAPQHYPKNAIISRNARSQARGEGQREWNVRDRRGLLCSTAPFKFAGIASLSLCSIPSGWSLRHSPHELELENTLTRNTTTRARWVIGRETAGGPWASPCSGRLHRALKWQRPSPSCPRPLRYSITPQTRWSHTTSISSFVRMPPDRVMALRAILFSIFFSFKVSGELVGLRLGTSCDSDSEPVGLRPVLENWLDSGQVP